MGMATRTQIQQTRFIVKLSLFMLLFCGVLVIAQEDGVKPLPGEVPADMVQAYNEARGILARSQDQVKSAQAVVQFTQGRIIAFCAKSKRVPDQTGGLCVEPVKKPVSPSNPSTSDSK